MTWEKKALTVSKRKDKARAMTAGFLQTDKVSNNVGMHAAKKKYINTRETVTNPSNSATRVSVISLPKRYVSNGSETTSKPKNKSCTCRTIGVFRKKSIICFS